MDKKKIKKITLKYFSISGPMTMYHPSQKSSNYMNLLIEGCEHIKKGCLFYFKRTNILYLFLF